MAGFTSMIKTVIIPIFLTVAVHTSWSQLLTAVKEASLKLLGEKLIKEKDGIALSIGMFHKGVEYSRHFGTIGPETNQPPSIHSIYEIGSVTKTFISLLLAKAIKDG